MARDRRGIGMARAHALNKSRPPVTGWFPSPAACRSCATSAFRSPLTH